MKDINPAKLKELAVRLLNPTDRFSEVSDKFEWKAVASPAVISALIEQLEAAQRERDEVKERLALVREQRDDEINRNTALEAELKRRDAQEPVLFTSQRSLDVRDKVTAFTSKESAEEYGKEVGWLSVVPLFAAYPAAVLPPEMTWAEANGIVCLPSIGEDRIEAFRQGANWMREQAKELGCQSEKVVKFPPAEKDGGTDWQGDITAGCINRMRDRCIAALDAAGVKWVEGE